MPAAKSRISTESRRIAGFMGRSITPTTSPPTPMLCLPIAGSSQAGIVRKYTDHKNRTMKHKMSLFVIYFGTSGAYTNSALSHHNVIVNERCRFVARHNKHHLPEDVYSACPPSPTRPAGLRAVLASLRLCRTLAPA